MPDELKPCPFCGGEGRINAKHYVNGVHKWWVQCAMCSAQTAAVSDPLFAITKWNRRDGKNAQIIVIEEVGE